MIKLFRWIPISNPRWWMFSAEVIVLAGGQQFGRSVKINSGNKQKSGKSELFNILAILDTGTSFITIPESQYKPFINTLIPPQAKRFCWVYIIHNDEFWNDVYTQTPNSINFSFFFSD